VKVDGVWSAVSPVEARALYGIMPKRCPAQVNTARNYTPPGATRYTTAVAILGCPLTPAAFSGRLSWHPQAIG
jgi:hypothetical protein